MAEYLIYFNQQWVGDHPEEWYVPRGPVARAVVEEMKEAGLYVFAGGLEEEDGQIYHADPTSGTTVISDGPYVETKEWLGGFALVEVPDDETAKFWAGRVAEACGWPHDPDDAAVRKRQVCFERERRVAQQRSARIDLA